MKLINVIRIFLWLKIKETWKILILVIGSCLFFTVGTYWIGFFILVHIFKSNNTSDTLYIWLFGALADCIIALFGLIIYGTISTVIMETTIPWLKSNWKEAKRIAEKQEKIENCPVCGSKAEHDMVGIGKGKITIDCNNADCQLSKFGSGVSYFNKPLCRFGTTATKRWNKEVKRYKENKHKVMESKK